MSQTTTSPSVATPERPKCAARECDEPGRYRCTRCKDVWYCTKKCSVNDWIFHMFECSNDKHKINVGHFLTRACRSGVVPTDPDTLDKFGWDNLNDPKDDLKLLRVYQTLFRIDPKLKPATLFKWCNTYVLGERIKETFERVPERDRGPYYSWYLKNQYVWDPYHMDVGAAFVHRLEARMHRNKAAFIGSYLQGQDPKTWPKEAQTCDRVCSLLQIGFGPAPNLPPEEWILFGFCTAKLTEEGHLIHLYKMLTRFCTFEQFVDAFTARTMYALMERKGIITDEDRVKLPRHFKRVTETEPEAIESVWYLRRYISAEGAAELTPNVSVDYGFANCESRADTIDLRLVYRTTFDHPDFDELMLDACCMQGKLYEYIAHFRRFVGEEVRRFRKLLQNPYPLPDLD